MATEWNVMAGPAGRLRVQDGTGAVRMQDCYDTDIEDLWSALTEPLRLARWIAEVSGDLRLGGEFQARFTSGWAGRGRVEVCQRPHRLLVSMSSGQADETVIEVQLSVEEGQTRLVIEERGLPVDELAGHGAGWQAHLEDLVAHLAGRDRGDWRTRWQQLTPHYTALAADAANIHGGAG